MSQPLEQAFFVTAQYALEPQGGGVQRCTHEYLRCLRGAGISAVPLTYAVDRRPSTRLRRKLAPAPYRHLISPASVDQIRQAIAAASPTWVFFNQIEAAQIVAELAMLRTGRTRFALLSHGVDSSDYLHTARVLGIPARRAARWLGQQVVAEMEMHRHFDIVFCLSETDRTFHQWLGATSVHLVPRVIENSPIDWKPAAGRVGTICTLNHAPNREGIVSFAAAAKKLTGTMKLRLIGRPESDGRALAEEYPNIEYLGGLSDEAFAEEARTWSAFINPIFCYARGCSTKLAVPLGWHLPIASTRAGARGYWWDEALVPLVDTPDELAMLAAQMASTVPDRTKVSTLAQRSPQLVQNAELFRTALRDAIRR